MLGVIYAKSRNEMGAKYYCANCDTWLDELNIVEWDEPRGEYWGIPCSEHMSEWRCPYCDSEDIYESRDIVEPEEEEDEL